MIKHILFSLLIIFQTAIGFAETGTNEHPVNLPMINDYTINREIHSHAIELYQSQMPNNDVLAVYTPTNPAPNSPVIVVSKIKDLSTMEEAEWLDSRLAIIDDLKQKHPNLTEINTRRELSPKLIHLKTTFSLDNTKREDVNVIKLILERNEALTTIYSAKLKADGKTYIGSITMMLLNGNIIILNMEWLNNQFTDQDFAHKYIDTIISKFIEANPKTTSVFSLPAR